MCTCSVICPARWPIVVERRQAGLTKPEGQRSGKLSIQFGSLESHLNQVSEWKGRLNSENWFWSFAALISKITRVNWHCKDSDCLLWVNILKSICEEAVSAVHSTRKCQKSTASKPMICKVSKVYFISTIKSACVLMKMQVLKTNKLQQYPDTAQGWFPSARRTRPEVI